MSTQSEASMAGWADVAAKVAANKAASSGQPLGLSIPELRAFTRELRKDAVMMTNAAQSGHTGGPFSMADYMGTLVANYLRVKPADPFWEGRDRMIISNGHTSALNYSLLCRRGFFSPGYLLTFRSTASRLQGHPNHIKLAGIEIGTGSLGQGVSVAHGMALGAKLSGMDEVRVFVNVGDGEMQEGQVWEAIMHAGHRGTDNLVLSVDYNDIQIDGTVRDVKRLDPLDDKLKSFHWEVMWCDGHDLEAISSAWEWSRKAEGKPKAIIFKTIMMQGVPQYENQPKWHGKFTTDEEAMACLSALGYSYPDIAAVRAEYGAPVYDGVVPKVLASPWARVLHMDTLEITVGEHNPSGH